MLTVPNRARWSCFLREFDVNWACPRNRWIETFIRNWTTRCNPVEIRCLELCNTLQMLLCQNTQRSQQCSTL